MTTLLDIGELTVRYGAITALRGVSLRVAAGEAVALLGANGAGKSTLMKAIIGLVAAGEGSIAFDGTPLAPLGADRRARLGIGYCPEGRRVFPGMTVRENLELACWADAATRARRLDSTYSLFPALREKHAIRAWQLSGGQQQMLAIGRALMNAPRLLLLDEPSLGLSPVLTDEVLRRVRDIVAGGTTVLLAEQNVAKALSVSSRAYVLRVGTVVRSGSAAELLASEDIRAAFLGG
jgi:branched-chain amino acid transport system ATP-binding protein